MGANELAECVNLTDIMDLKQEHHLETKFNISMNSIRSVGEQDFVFHSEFRV